MSAPATASLPTLTFEQGTTAPPPGSIRFYDGYFPALPAGSYTIEVKQTLAAPEGPSPSYAATREFDVEAPAFTIDPSIVNTAYPPPGASGTYGQQLPFVVLGDPSLPWERAIVPGGGSPGPADPIPWIALAIFAEGEIALQPGSSNPVLTEKVAKLLEPRTGVLKPQIADVPEALLVSQCQTITVSGGAFNAVMPELTDLRYLAHCRALSRPDEDELLLSVALANRLPRAEAAPRRYFAHLVSLEGFAEYLGPNAKPIPEKPGGGPSDVQLVSLFSWTFVSNPQPGVEFGELVRGLIASEQQTPALRLPPPSSESTLPPVAEKRLHDGYVPLPFVSGAGEQSFAWYRGPFTPVVAQPLPEVGEPPVEVADATSADMLAIYLAEQGLFDLSYAAAWNIGRQLALADGAFAEAMSRYRREGREALTRLAQRLGLPHLRGVQPRALLARDASRRQFMERLSGGLARRWTEAMAAARAGERPRVGPGVGTAREARGRRLRGVHPRTVLEAPWAAELLGEQLADAADPLGAWLAKLSLLGSMPFSHLVADPRMLPTESVRFFYVDQGWIDALLAGAGSIAIHSSADLALMRTLKPSLERAIAAHRARLTGAASPTAMSGVLIRSALVSGWPALVVSATLGGAPLPSVRDDRPSPSVRLCLFEGMPDEVSVAEPYQGLLFGAEEGAVAPRNVAAATATGAQIANLKPLPVVFRNPPAGATDGVLDVQALAAELQAAVCLTPFSAAAIVAWNGTPLQTTVVSTSRLEAVVPVGLIATAGTAQVTVTDGASSDPATFTISAPLAIEALDPSMVSAGHTTFTLNIAGVGFQSDAQVEWNGAPLKTTFVSALELVAIVPADLVAVPGRTAVTARAGERSTAPAEFTIVTDGPAISSLEPSVAAARSGGFALAVIGSGFDPTDTTVNWNGAMLVTKFIGPTQLSASVPGELISSPATIEVTVTSAGRTSNGVPFTVAGAGPVISSFQHGVAVAGREGFELVVWGVNFGDDALVSWNGEALVTTRSGSRQLTASVPANRITSAVIVAVTVTSGGLVSPPASFVVLAPMPAIGLLQPASVVAGGPQFTLTVTGGFGAGDFAVQMVDAPELQAFPSNRAEPS